MKISVITPSFNQGSFIEKNIQSVMNQNWCDIEHIVVDGGSTDNTVEVLKKYPHVRWISEKDEGQADALNKGLTMATGDIIGWINSDDFYVNNIFADVLKNFDNQDIQWVIGDIILKYIDINIEVKSKSPKITYKNLMKNPDIVRQQATFFRKKAVDTVGGLDKSFYMTMDYDLWIRLSKKWTPLMINQYWAYFTLHKEQKSTLKNSLVQISDIMRVMKKEKATKKNIIRILAKKYFFYFKGKIKQQLVK